MDVELYETQPEQSKNKAFAKLKQPNIWGDLHILIGIFGFYIQFLLLYDMDTRPCRYTFSNNPQIGALSQY